MKEVGLTERLKQTEICEVAGIQLETWKGYTTATQISLADRLCIPSSSTPNSKSSRWTFCAG